MKVKIIRLTIIFFIIVAHIASMTAFNFPSKSSVSKADYEVSNFFRLMLIGSAKACDADECMTVTAPRQMEMELNYWWSAGGGAGSEGPNPGAGGGNAVGQLPSQPDAMEQYLTDPESISDTLSSMAQIKLELNRLLQRVGLSTEVKNYVRGEIAKLDRVIAKGNLLISAINSGSQTAIHAAKGEYLHAAAEVVGLVAAVTAGALVSGPVVTILAAFTVV